MGLTHYPHGLSSFGAPVLPEGTSIPTGSGKIIFVDALHGNDGQDGASPSSAFASIGRGILACTSGAGDTVYVYPGTYSENVSITKDYVSVIGAIVGGYARPDVTPSTLVPLSVSGHGVVVRHMRFAGTGADSCIQTANGFLYEDCVFDGDGTAAKAGLRLLPSSTNTHLTASEGIMVGNLFRGCANGVIFDTGAAPVGVGSTDNVIAYNEFQANTLDLATADSGGAGTVYSVQVTDIGPGNVFADKNKAVYIDLTTTNGGAASDQSGSIVGNYFASDTITTTKIKMVGTAFTFMGNFSTVGVVDGSGLD